MVLPVSAGASGKSRSIDCNLREFACDDRCIARTKLCDRDVDCTLDGADETPLLCSKSIRNPADLLKNRSVENCC